MKHSERKYLIQFLELYDLNTKTQLGFLGDISEDGIMFISSNPPPINTTLDISIIDSREVSSEKSIYLQIETLWIKNNINPAQFCIGCQILKIDPENEQSLKEIGESLAFNSEFKINRVGDQKSK